MAENKILNGIKVVYFTALAFMMYYFITQDISIGGIGMTMRHLYALLLILSAFVLFMVSPKMADAVVSLKSSAIYAVPMLVTFVATMLVWIVEKSGMETITRGISAVFIYTNWFSCALAAAALLYVFGEKGIWINLAALVASNMFMIFQIIAENGVGPFFSELITLITSFADNTGDIIVKAEIHELAFCMGAYLIYMLFKPRKKAWFWVLFGLAAFCFLCAFKRIAMVAMVAVAVFRVLLWLTDRFSKKLTCHTANVIMIVAFALMILYIVIIKADVFQMLEDGGVDTSGRAFVYHRVGEYYEFSPFYYGRGIGFLTYQLNEVIHIGVTAVHNDFLQFYIDLGFWGYILWLLSMTVLRTSYFGRHGDSNTASIACLLIIYLFIVSSTDNTINYPLLTTVIGIIIMGNGYEKNVERQQEKLDRMTLGASL